MLAVSEQSISDSALRGDPSDSSPMQQSYEVFPQPSPQGSEENLKSNVEFSIAEATWDAERTNI
eukprot:4491465-Pyramimonas_sp.AAC.1